jgi:hypothetical protein
VKSLLAADSRGWMISCALAIIFTLAWAARSDAQTPAPPSSGTAGSPVAGTTAQSGALLHLAPGNEASVQKAGQLLEQMVVALGGEAYLNIRDMEQEGRTYSFFHGQAKGAGALFWRFWQWPDKERIELTKQRDWIIIYRGDEGFETTYKGTSAVEPEPLEDYLRRRNHSLIWILRKWLQEPGFAIFYEGSSIAERKQADEVSVITAHNDSASIWIDSTTHLPLKVGFTWRDKDRYKVDESEGYDSYREIQGIMTPFSVTRYKDGDAITQRFINGVKYNQNVPASMFEAKINIVPEKKKR